MSTVKVTPQLQWTPIWFDCVVMCAFSIPQLGQETENIGILEAVAVVGLVYSKQFDNPHLLLLFKYIV